MPAHGVIEQLFYGLRELFEITDHKRLSGRTGDASRPKGCSHHRKAGGEVLHHLHVDASTSSDGIDGHQRATHQHGEIIDKPHQLDVVRWLGSHVFGTSSCNEPVHRWLRRCKIVRDHLSRQIVGRPGGANKQCRAFAFHRVIARQAHMGIAGYAFESCVDFSGVNLERFGIGVAVFDRAGQNKVRSLAQPPFDFALRERGGMSLQPR